MERDFIGSIILYPKQVQTAIELVNENDFTDQRAKKVFSHIKKHFLERRPITPISLAQDTGEAVFVAESTSGGSFPLVREYGKRIADKAKKERIKERLAQITSEGVSVEDQLDGLMDIYTSELSIDKKKGDIASVFNRFDEHVEMNKSRGSIGVKTGIGFLNAKYIEYVAGHIWVMGAFTSVGKTSMMIQKVCSLLKNNSKARIVIISTEMTEQQMVARIISNFTGISTYSVLSGRFNETEGKAIDGVKSFILDRSVSVYDDVYTLVDIEKTLRKEKLQGGFDVCFIDYVQNCQVPEATSAYQEQSILAKRLQALAKETTSCFVCLSQVSNSVGRGDTDQIEFKGAGEWAAVIDYGVMLKRNKDDEVALLYDLRKNRHGAKFSQEMRYVNNFSSIIEV